MCTYECNVPQTIFDCGNADFNHKIKLKLLGKKYGVVVFLFLIYLLACSSFFFFNQNKLLPAKGLANIIWTECAVIFSLSSAPHFVSS